MNLTQKQKILVQITAMDGSKYSKAKVIKDELMATRNGHLYLDGEKFIMTFREGDDVVALSICVDEDTKSKASDTSAFCYLVQGDKAASPSNPQALKFNPSMALDQELRKVMNLKFCQAVEDFANYSSLIKINLNFEEMISGAIKNT